jgi:hypothetical protein
VTGFVFSGSSRPLIRQFFPFVLAFIAARVNFVLQSTLMLTQQRAGPGNVPDAKSTVEHIIKH